MEVGGYAMKILLADDHALFREGIRLVLHRLGPGIDIQEACNYTELLTMVSQHPEVDLILVDLDMPGGEPFTTLKQLMADHPTLPVVVLTASEAPEHMHRALELGIMGYIPKRETSDVMLGALQLVLAGGVYIPRLMMEQGHIASKSINAEGLTPRQLDVLRCIVLGMSNKHIGRELGLTEATVKVHVSAIFRALGVSNRTQAAHAAEQLGLLTIKY